MNRSAVPTRSHGPEPRGLASPGHFCEELPVRVIGIGNPMRADDALGWEALLRLERDCLPGVDYVRFGGDCSQLAELLLVSRAAVVIDAVHGAGEPGTLVFWDLADPRPELVPHGEARISGHGYGICETLGLCRLLGRLPRPLVLVGVEGLTFGFGTEMSAPVAAALPSVVGAVRQELRRIAGRP
ncbi:MAG: hydrogenase maturation protease [Candidatus Wallbacteria bacterium]|nr:hydrogenase maturation protease [Candidatus Wallbacteria bacterium]